MMGLQGRWFYLGIFGLIFGINFGLGCQPTTRQKKADELCATRWRHCPTSHTRTICDYQDLEEDVYWPEPLVISYDPWLIMKQHLLHRLGKLSSDPKDAFLFHISKKKLCGKGAYGIPDFGIGFQPTSTLFRLFTDKEHEHITRLTHDRVSVNASTVEELTPEGFKERIKDIDPMLMMDNLLAVGKLYAYSLFADGCARSDITVDKEVNRMCLKYQMVFGGVLAEPPAR